MKRRYTLIVIVLFIFSFGFSQQFVLKKGTIIDTIPIRDSIQESFALYLPSSFENKGKWPILFVFDTKGKGKQVLAMFRKAAEDENYILAASNSIRDSLSLSKNVAIAGRMISKANSILPINTDRVYTAGFSSGGRLASIMPAFFKGISGVVSIGSSLANVELLTLKNPFHFIGIVGSEDYSYPKLLEERKILFKNKYPNNLILFNGGKEWPSSGQIHSALSLFTLSAMAKGNTDYDSLYVKTTFNKDLRSVSKSKKEKDLVLASTKIDEMLRTYRAHMDMDSLRRVGKSLKKDKLYKSLKRKESATFFKEQLLKDDFVYYLEEDIYTYNYNNLGWWTYQMEKLNKFMYGDSESERQMGKRLHSFVNALIEDNIQLVKAEKQIDDEALILLSMLKTITNKKDFKYYLDVISLSSKYEDYGTALFYLEEALKKGFKDTQKLDELPNTALLRIAPEYNTLLEKYLNDTRYQINDE